MGLRRPIIIELKGEESKTQSLQGLVGLESEPLSGHG